MKFFALIITFFFTLMAYSQSEKTIINKTYDNIKKYRNHIIDFETWEKFVSDDDTSHSHLQTQLGCLLGIPAMAINTTYDAYDTAYIAMDLNFRTLLSKHFDSYSHFEKKTDPDIQYNTYLYQVVFKPFTYRKSQLEKYQLMADTSNYYYVLKKEESIKDDLETTEFIDILYVRKTDFMPMILENWAYFAGGVQYTKSIVNSIQVDETSAKQFMHLNDSLSRSYRTHLNADSIYKLNHATYTFHQLGDTVIPINGVIHHSKDSVNLFELGDSILIIDFAYTNCGWCSYCIPALNAIHNAYDSVNGVALYSVNPYKNDWRLIDKFVEHYQVKYSIVEINYEYVKNYGVEGFPTLFIIKNGVIVFMHHGYSKDLEKILNREIKKALGQS